MERVYNFSAGPGALPIEVLEEAQKEMMNYRGLGLSVMEMSHRSGAFKEIIEEAEASIRRLLKLADNYKVLFLQGGAHLQFSMVPLNLMTRQKKADYIISGNWANKAYQEALKFGDARIVASSVGDNFSSIPKTQKTDFRTDVDYVHICVNNTIYGTRFRPDNLPDCGNLDLVGDMSSNILSEEYDLNKFALVYAGAQKNMGPAGVTLVIIRDDLVGLADSKTPVMLDYKPQVEAKSLYNTPPCYSIYICGLVYKWLEKMGGVSAVAEINRRKATKLYDFIDNSNFYQGTAAREDRSLMNVTFVCQKPDLHPEFIKQAEGQGLLNLKGHRKVGGIRASIYNAMPEAGVDRLIQFMQDFARHNK